MTSPTYLPQGALSAEYEFHPIIIRMWVMTEHERSWTIQKRSIDHTSRSKHHHHQVKKNERSRYKKLVNVTWWEISKIVVYGWVRFLAYNKFDLVHTLFCNNNFMYHVLYLNVYFYLISLVCFWAACVIAFCMCALGSTKCVRVTTSSVFC